VREVQGMIKTLRNNSCFQKRDDPTESKNEAVPKKADQT
jgi:hypothetical protein